MEEGPRAGCATHFSTGIAKACRRTRSRQADCHLLCQRLPGEYRHQHFEAERLRGTLECARQLGSMEKSRIRRGELESGMSDSTTAALPRRSFGETTRPDAWWLQPLVVFLGLSTFI